MILVWNIHNANEKHLKLMNRTNNALEKCNRRMNNKFPCAHPNVNVFVETLEEEGRQQSKRLDDTRNGHEIADDCGKATIPNFPLKCLECRDEHSTKKEKDKKEKSKKEKNAKAKVKKRNKK